jgi:hypothetical protein
VGHEGETRRTLQVSRIRLDLNRERTAVKPPGHGHQTARRSDGSRSTAPDGDLERPRRVGCSRLGVCFSVVPGAGGRGISKLLPYESMSPSPSPSPSTQVTSALALALALAPCTAAGHHEPL